MIPASLFLSLHELKLCAADGYILARIAAEGPLPPADFVGEKKLSRHVVSRRLRELKTAGLLIRLPNEDGDGRAFPYGLTDKSRGLLTLETVPA